MAEIPAAAYLRMSTEHQQYSLANQSMAIETYAKLKGLRVVQTYSDAAKSGLVLNQRDGLRQLLQDVVTGSAAYKAILVYDVSRWGRFQDPDEAAHYEFLCRSAGIPIHYCAEPFTNDGSITNSLLKTIKRTMAAEYSREMGVKIAAGQRNVYLKGFRGHGALPGFGLRRMLVSSEGTPKQLLADGELKAIQTDRVILVPGPPEEVAWVREIFRLFIEEKHSYRKIAEILNERGVMRGRRPWNLFAVKYLLSSTKYNGVLTFGIWTRRLHTKCRKNPESEWLAVPHPTAKIIDDATFAAARSRMRGFTVNKTDEELLDELRAILAENGRLSSYLIRRTPGATSPFSLRCRFGSLLKAFQRIGYVAPKMEKLVANRRKVRDMQLQLMEKLKELFPAELSVHHDCGPCKSNRKWLQTRSGARISVRLCIQPPNIRWKPAWRLNQTERESRWTTVVGLLNRQNTEIERLLVFPRTPIGPFYVSRDAEWLRCGVELRDLNDFLKVVKHARTASK